MELHELYKIFETALEILAPEFMKQNVEELALQYVKRELRTKVSKCFLDALNQHMRIPIPDKHSHRHHHDNHSFFLIGSDPGPGPVSGPMGVSDLLAGRPEGSFRPEGSSPSSASFHVGFIG